jgi:hypothetical protein
MREVAATVAAAVAAVAWEQGHATRPRPDHLAEVVRDGMYQPRYQ